MYTLENFESDVAKLQPRFVDVWVIPPALIYLSLSQKGLGRWPRRLMLGAGLYMLLRNYGNYKAAAQSMAGIAQSKTPLVDTKTATIDKIVSLVDMPDTEGETL